MGMDEVTSVVLSRVSESEAKARKDATEIAMFHDWLRVLPTSEEKAMSLPTWIKEAGVRDQRLLRYKAKDWVKSGLITLVSGTSRKTNPDKYYITERGLKFYTEG